MKFFRGTRWLPILAGGMLALLGFVCTLYPGVMADLFPLLAGVCVLALGLGEGAFGFTLRKTGGDGGPLLLQGVVNVAVGCVLLLNQNVSKVFIAVLLAIWVFVAGVLRARTAWRLARRGRRWGAVAVDAFVKCALGVVVGVYPLQGLAAGIVLLGVVLLLLGISVIVGALYVDRTFRDADAFFDDYFDGRGGRDS